MSKKYKIPYKIGVILLAFCVFLGIFPAQKAEAGVNNTHNFYWVQTTLDESTFTYTGVPKADILSAWTISGEAAHDLFKYNFERDLNASKMYPDLAGLEDHYDGYLESARELEENPNYTFAFPPKAHLSTFKKTLNHATPQDSNRAKEIATSLTGNLNGAINLLWNGRKPASRDEHIARTAQLSQAIMLIKDGGSTPIGKYTLTQGKIKPYEKGVDPSTGLSNSDWVTISDGTRKADFIYRYPKGYNPVPNWDSSHLQNGLSYSEDVKYITWNMIMYQAHAFLYDANIGTSNSNEVGAPGYMEEKIVELTESAFASLTGLLGLYTIAELIYNEGTRSSNVWHYGVFQDNWSDNIDTFFWIFQALAWSLIAAAMFKIVIQRNASIVNPSLRASLMEGVQDLLITALLLACIYPFINFLLLMNFRLVGIFSSMGINLSNLAGTNNYNGTLGGMLLQLYYFFINIWLNVVYIVRGITIAILVVLSPLFVVSIAFGGKWKGMFGTFSRELMGSIFLQAFHAFILTFILLVTPQTRGIETAIILFALIALTEMFRVLMFGTGGGIAGAVGLKSVAAGAGIIGGASTAIQRGARNKNRSKNGGESGGGGESFTGESSGNEQGGDSSSNSSGEASNFKTNDSSGLANGGREAAYSNVGDSNSKSGSGLGSMAAGVGKATAMTAGLGAATAVGAAYAMAFGSVDPNAAKVAGGIIGGSAGATKRAWGNVGMGNRATNSPTAGTNNTLGGSESYSGTIVGGPNDRPPGGGELGNTTNSIGGPGGDGASRGIPLGSGPLDPSGGGNASELENGNIGHLGIQKRVLGSDGIDDIHREQEVLSEQGLLRANDIDGTNNAEFVYDTDKLSEQNRNGLLGAENRFNNGTDEDRAELKEQGIESIGRTGDGHLSVMYNQKGKEDMGVSSVNSYGSKIVQSVPSGSSGNMRLVPGSVSASNSVIPNSPTVNAVGNSPSNTGDAMPIRTASSSNLQNAESRNRMNASTSANVPSNETSQAVPYSNSESSTMSIQTANTSQLIEGENTSEREQVQEQERPNYLGAERPTQIVYEPEPEVSTQVEYESEPQPEVEVESESRRFVYESESESL